MGTSCGGIYRSDQDGPYDSGDLEIFHSTGPLVCRFDIHSTEQADGSLRAQFELRFENQSMLVIAPEVGLEPEGYPSGRTWVLVEMVQRQSLSEPLRFSIHIPSPASDAGIDPRIVQEVTSAVKQQGNAVSTVRSRCCHTHGCYYPVCDMDEDRTPRQLADDRCIASMVALETLALQPQDPGSQR